MKEKELETLTNLKEYEKQLKAQYPLSCGAFINPDDIAKYQGGNKELTESAQSKYSVLFCKGSSASLTEKGWLEAFSYFMGAEIKKYINNELVEIKEYLYNSKQELISEEIIQNVVKKQDGVIIGVEGLYELVTSYTYDDIGNILTVTRPYKKDEYASIPYQITLSYNDNTNPTKLTSYTIKQNESSTGTTYNVTYDNFGNIINDGQHQYTYDIDKLISITTNNKNIIYEYNSSGIRTYKKIINPDNTYEEIYYEVSGDMILQERRFNSSTNTTTYIRYIYDETGVVGFKTGTDINNLTTYYFVKNMQNDIVEIIDTNLNSVVKYTYDAYGNVFISGTLSSTIGELNPYRYRGYYYDEETSMFWLSSRY